MARAATATINLSALRHNYLLAKQAAENSQAVAVIKADAYGHGAIKVAEALADIADAFAVACIEEAIELRQAGVILPILLLEGFFTTDELELIQQHQLWCAIHRVEQIEVLAQATLTQPIKVWLKMDSGMHRLGVPAEQYLDAYQQLKALPQVSDVVLMSHFASADNLASTTTQKQIQLFDSITASLNEPVSLANSAATLAFAEARRTWQRPGIMLYGASPFDGPLPLADKLQAVMTLSSEIIAVRVLKAGDAVGYGETWTCDKSTRVGTVAMGYADGYPRHAKNGTPVIVNGQRTRLIGRVSMDMLTVDLTDIEAKVGSPVELWGDNLKATEVASYCDTISYTLFTGITKRVHKRYIAD